MASESSSLYSREFYERNRTGSFASAEIVVKLVLDLVSAQSVCDLGCGTGTWLRAFGEAGVGEIAGFDGPWVSADMLQIPAENFTTANLSKPIQVTKSFDLSLSLEVAEHLPASAADGFVETLTRLAPVVLFSAAIPHQLGDGHINEQWQSYWIDKFAAQRFKAIDCIRPIIWNDRRIEYWYRQNIFLFASEQGLKKHAPLRTFLENAVSLPANLVHPEAFLGNRQPEDFLGAAKLLPSLFARAVGRRLGTSNSEHSK